MQETRPLKIVGKKAIPMFYISTKDTYIVFYTHKVNYHIMLINLSIASVSASAILQKVFLLNLTITLPLKTLNSKFK